MRGCCYSYREEDITRIRQIRALTQVISFHQLPKVLTALEKWLGPNPLEEMIRESENQEDLS
jgi:hypothetical protein